MTDAAGFTIDLFMQDQNSSRTDPRTTAASPTRPGAYWFKDETLSGYVLVNVSWKNGELTAWLVDRNVPVADLNGHWAGPIPLF